MMVNARKSRRVKCFRTKWRLVQEVTVPDVGICGLSSTDRGRKFHLGQIIDRACMYVSYRVAEEFM